MAFLTRTDLTPKHRSVLRRGSPGTVRLASYQHRADAELAERRSIKKRLQHGHRAF
jgi:hypothetical protein